MKFMFTLVRDDQVLAQKTEEVVLGGYVALPAAVNHWLRNLTGSPPLRKGDILTIETKKAP